MRSIVSGAGFGEAEITRFGQESNYLIKVKDVEVGAKGGTSATAPTDSLGTPEGRVAKKIQRSLCTIVRKRERSPAARKLETERVARGERSRWTADPAS